MSCTVFSVSVSRSTEAASRPAVFAAATSLALAASNSAVCFCSEAAISVSARFFVAVSASAIRREAARAVLPTVCMYSLTFCMLFHVYYCGAHFTPSAKMRVFLKHIGAAMSDILNKILAVKAQEVAAAKSVKPLPAIRASAELAAPPRDFTGAIRGKIKCGEGRGDRRNQESQPEQGRAACRFSSRRDRRELCATRRRMFVGADRRAVLSGQHGVSAAGACRLHAASAAQGFHRGRIPDLPSRGRWAPMRSC